MVKLPQTVERALVWRIQAPRLDHFMLVLQQKLSALQGCSGCLADGGCDASKEEIFEKGGLLRLRFRHCFVIVLQHYSRK
jgi:hypothetical protein